MENNNSNKKNPLSSADFYKVTLSIILLLLVIIALTGRTVIGAFFTYIFAFCFGYFYPIVLVFLAILALKMIFTKKGFPFKKYLSFNLGLIIVFIASLCFASYFLIVNDADFNFSKLSIVYTDIMKSFARRPSYIDSFSSLSSLGGGYIGAFLVALFGSIWHKVGDGIFFSILMLAGIALILYKPISYLIKQVKEKRKEKVTYKSDYQNKEEKKEFSNDLTDLSSWNKEDSKEESSYVETPYIPQGDLKSTSTFTPIENKEKKIDRIEDSPTDIKYDNEDYSYQGGLKSSSTLNQEDNSSIDKFSDNEEEKEEVSFSSNYNSSIDDKKEDTTSNFDDYKSPFETSKNSYESKTDEIKKDDDLSSIQNEFSSLRDDSSSVKFVSRDSLNQNKVIDDALQEDDDDFISDSGFNNNDNKSDEIYSKTSYQDYLDKEEDQDVNSSLNNTYPTSSSYDHAQENRDYSYFNPLEEQAKRASKAINNTSITIDMSKKEEEDKDDEVELSDEEKNQIKIDEYFKKKRDEEARAKALKEEEDRAKKAELYKYVSNVERFYTYPLPDDTLLDDIDDSSKIEENRNAAQEKGHIIDQVFEDFNIKAKVQSSTIGSSVTRFNIALEKGVKSEKLTSIITELQRALKGDKSVRIETVVEGQDMPGIEIGNAKSMAVSFKEVFTTIEQNTKDNLLIPIGKDISGNIVTYPLNKMPHLLVAGTTGSGKSVLVHSIIMTLLMRNYPSRLKLMLIDPKQVEFNKYQMEPHLFCPIISDAEQAVIGLAKLCDEMDRRYQILKEYGIVNMDEYRELKATSKNPSMIEIPDIVCIIDEFADLMQTSDGAVTDSIQRITQKARAAGIYMIIATQRPEKNVIPGVIKSNIPCRIGLSCSSTIDSRVILDEVGAETLLGKGDLLFKCTSNRNLVRAQSPFISNNDIARVLDYLKLKAGVPNYSPDFLDLKPDIEEDPNSSYGSTPEEMYEKIKDFVISTKICSKSVLMKNFSLSYSKSEQILNRLKQDGIIESVQGNGYRVTERYE